MASLEIIIGNESRSVQAEAGDNLLEVLRKEQFFLAADCNGNGTCGKCKVKISEHTKRTFHEVLSCRTEVFDGMLVEVAASNKSLGEAFTVNDTETFIGDASTKDIVSAKEYKSIERDTFLPAKGIAVDLGTTTIAASLIRLSDGTVLDSRQEWNQQIPYGADVMSRLHYLMQHDEGLATLSEIVQKQIDEIVSSLFDSSVSQSDFPVMIAGNTIMQHIYAGIDPSSMASAPYKPATLFEDMPGLTPCISAFIGGDITSGLYAAGLSEKTGNWLFLDIGTNGEMALGGKDGFLCASVATGPAFEGAQITCGCYGRPGAVSHISWDRFTQKLNIEMISKKNPGANEHSLTGMKGICGSGLIDLIAILTELGIITKEGRILSPYELEDQMEEGLIDEDIISALENQLGIDFLQEDSDGNGVFYLNSDSSTPVYLCTKDVHQLQLAKASVRAGVEILLKEKQLSPDNLDGIILAGGFGSHLNLDQVEAIGMLPKGSSDKIIQAGNTSLLGAGKYLTECYHDSCRKGSDMGAVDIECFGADASAHKKLLHIQELCDYIELADTPEFAELFLHYLPLA